MGVDTERSVDDASHAAPGAPLTGTGATVRITDTQGRAACGSLAEAPRGVVRLVAEEGTVEVPLSGIAAIVPVDAC